MYIVYPSSSSLLFPCFGCEYVDKECCKQVAVMKNLQTGGSGSSSRSYHSPEDKFAHLLPKRRAQKGSDDRDPNYIPEQQELW
jgi:hypothetical protein